MLAFQIPRKIVTSTGNFQTLNGPPDTVLVVEREKIIMASENGNKAKTICSICYEDLKPIVEDLQAIPICGHVFHELCLQQWFEYCPSKKKHTCPICKQNCTANKACRLYFQSIGNVNEDTLTQRVSVISEDPQVLYREVKRLEAKVVGLNSTIEHQTKDLKELSEELHLYKELARKEAASKDEAVQQRVAFQQLLLLKSQELETSTAECLRLQERNMALAKELAALKLASDLDLEEDEVLKLASLGNGANNGETIDILKKSLLIRNKSYKELMVKCNLLGRGEARCSRKLEKAKEKIRKLKIRVQELETAIEAKENEALRALKRSKIHIIEGAIHKKVDYNSTSILREATAGDQHRQSSIARTLADSTCCIVENSKCSSINYNMHSVKDGAINNHNHIADSLVRNKGADVHVVVDEDDKEPPIAGDGFLTPKTSENSAIHKAKLSTSDINSSSKKELMVSSKSISPNELSCSRPERNNCQVNAIAVDDDVMLLDDDMPTINIIKENPSIPLSMPGDICFSGGLLGPDGTSRYLGKWCKRSKDMTIKNVQGAIISSGNLIAVGSDGRGGRVKALRPFQSSVDIKQISAKRSKNESKTSVPHSQGCLQIEHFFGKRGQ